MTYVELHLHSCFSFREGASTPLELLLQAKKLGYTALALTDHNNLAGAMEFARTARAWRLQPITGAEVTLTPVRSEGGKPGTLKQGQSGLPGPLYHLTLLAETPRGYANLCRLLTRANLDNPLRRGISHDLGPPVIAFDWLQGNAEGLIALSGCRKGEVPALAEAGDYAAAREAAGRLRDLFGPGSFFLELQENLTFTDQPRNEALVRLARDLGLGFVASNNVHYHVRERHRLHDVLTAVRALKTLDEARPLLRPNSEFYLKSPQEMERLFADLPEAITGTLRIAERCTGSAADQYRRSGDLQVARSAPIVLGASIPSTTPGNLKVSATPASIPSTTPGNLKVSATPASIPSSTPGNLKVSATPASIPSSTPGNLKVSAAPASIPSSTTPGNLKVSATPAALAGGFDLTRDLSYVFPDYDSPDGRDANDFLADVCIKRGREIYRSRWPEVEPRLRNELELIRQGNRAGFFLRLWELIQTAHANDLPVRGRGSSVGSLVCYLLGLSGIDPIKYDLFVGRFLNEARLEEDVPDIDLDFGRDARDTMFRTIFEKYGTDHAAQVCNFIEYRYASAVRDVGKALGLPPGDIDKIAKRLRSRFSRSLSHEIAEMPEFARRLRPPRSDHQDPASEVQRPPGPPVGVTIWQDFARLVEELRGFPRHLSQHSGGVIISTTRIDEQVPVERPAMEGRFICQWDKDSVADAGMIKLDLLAYPTLDQLYRGLRYVFERHGRLIRPDDIDLDDADVYAMVQEGDTIGIVQIQSRAQIQVLLRIKVQTIHDLVIQVALIRPGPIQGGAVNPYIARSLGQEPVTFDHPSLEDVLGETKGVFIFQEQVIQAAMAVAGFTPGQAEMLRRAMSRKRSREAMEALREAFIEGARDNGVDPGTAATVYSKILAFAEFGFPKSHAAAMAETAYKVAWLKRYYAAEFYCALLNEQPMGFYSEEVICNDARRHDIEVRGVDVNHSRSECTIESDPSTGSGRGDAIRLGYRYVKGIGEAAWKRLDEEAANGPYRSLWDFWRRTGLGREAIENLIQLGAFAFTGLHERELVWQLGTFYQPLNAQRPLALSFAGESVTLQAMTPHQRVVADLILTGIAVRGRSMDLIADRLHEGIAPSNMVNQMAEGTPVTVAGLVAVRQAPETAKGFVFHTLEDYFGHVNIITRPQLVPKYRHLIESAAALIVHGHIERQERAVNVIAERFEGIEITGAAGSRVHSFG